MQFERTNPTGHIVALVIVVGIRIEPTSVVFVVSVQSALLSSFNHTAKKVIPFRGTSDKPMLQQFTRRWPLKYDNLKLGLIITAQVHPIPTGMTKSTLSNLSPKFLLIC